MIMKKNNYPKVSIIILNWNGLKDTIDALESLKKTTYPNYEVVLVDNGSEGNDADILEERYSHYIKLIRNKKNLGVSRGINIATKQIFKEGESDYILLLNNDIKIIQEDWLDKFVKIGESEENIGIIGCTLLFPSGKFQKGGEIFKKPSNYTNKTKNIIEVDLVCGACSMIKKKVVDKIGLLDENFSPAYYEESDYYLRAKKAGFKVIYAPEIKIIHRGRVATRNLRGLNYIEERNHLRFVLLNCSLGRITLTFLYDFAMCFFARKDKNKKITLRNLKIRKDWISPLKNFLRAGWYNLKGLKEISYKRKNRTQRIWS